MDRPLAPGQNYVGLTIDEVDVANRIAHCFDKTNSPVKASFRESGAVFHIPQKGERWTAKQQGWTWHLESRIDSAEEHDWTTAHLKPGDTRLGSQSSRTYLNRLPIGATVTDTFYNTANWTTATLSATPVSVDCVVPYLNGLALSPDLWRLDGKTVTFRRNMAIGRLVFVYQTWDEFVDTDLIPSNDDIVNALELVGSSGTIVGTLVGATSGTPYDPITDPAWDAGFSSVWYKLALPHTGTFTATVTSIDGDVGSAVLDLMELSVVPPTKNADINSLTSGYLTVGGSPLTWSGTRTGGDTVYLGVGSSGAGLAGQWNFTIDWSMT